MGQEFDIVLIKPTHYDDDGYPIIWWRSFIPSNTLAVLFGIATDCARRQVLGTDVRINVRPLDETNSVVRPERIIADLQERGARALIAMVGVQTNQFDRAMDLARPFRSAGIPVCIGGFHVSGVLAMLLEPPAEIHAAWDAGISLFAGECEEGRFDEVVIDAWQCRLKPLYNYLDHLPDLRGAPTPILPASAVNRNFGDWSSFDLGRGCPYQCSFCTIINVQGRKSRFRTPDDLETIVRENYAQGVKALFITDDNFARNALWEEFFDRLIELRGKGIKANLTIQVDTLCHKIDGFIDKAAQAGVNRVFIGLENINPDNLLAANKRQNKITEYRDMLLEWHDRGVFTFAGYIIGFPADTKESILRDVEIIKREMPIDVLEFFILQPLPGSEDHRRLLAEGIWMDPDLNKYNVHKRVSHHPVMSDSEWEEAYDAAWKSYYSYDHIEVVGKRHARRHNGRPDKAIGYLSQFRLMYEIEQVHPLEGGILRLRRRRDRRPSFPRELPVLFHLRFVAQTFSKAARFAVGLLRQRRIIQRVKAAKGRCDYIDAALMRGEADYDDLELFTKTQGGKRAVARRRYQQALETRLRSEAHP